MDIELEHSSCRHCSDEYPRGTSQVENLPRIQGSKTFPSALDWSNSKTYPSTLHLTLPGVVVTPKYIPTYISCRKPTTHRGQQNLPFDIDLELSYCRHYSNVHSKQKTSLFESQTHIDGSNTFPTTLNWSLLGVVVTPKYIADAHLCSKACHTWRVIKPPLRHGIGAFFVSSSFKVHSRGTSLVESLPHIKGSNAFPST